MASVEIRIWMSGRNYTTELEYPETNAEAWGSDKSHIDELLAQAVTDIKRAYHRE